MEKIGRSDPLPISVSVVSHGQLPLIVNLMQDMQASCVGKNFELILTLNVAEVDVLDTAQFSYPIKIIRNTRPKGFGANHNHAFRVAVGSYFCVVNPDIRFDSCPFSRLLAGFECPGVGVVAPLVLSPEGRVEDSARRFPTPATILSKLFFRPQLPDYSFQDGSRMVDWAGGMFMVFPRSVFQNVNGFDERFFLYYEDVDICARLSLIDLQIWVCAEAQVVHHAQRSSHRDLKYMVWHLGSMLRFFMSPVYRQLKKLHRL